ncbi:MAG: double zinc ribbon domain-containing protein, partial [Spirochaetota bacterium]
MSEHTCPECGNPIEAQWRACPECGADLKLTCYSCAQEIRTQWKICPFCKARLICPDCDERMDGPSCENCAPLDEDTDGNFEIGMELMEKEEYEAAAESFTESIAAHDDPNANESAYYNRGICRLLCEQFADAEADFTTAIEIDPGSSRYYYQRGRCRYYTDKYPEALEDLDLSLEKDPE